MNKHQVKKLGELEKKSLRLFKGDAATLDECFPEAGHSVVIRMLVRNFIKKLENNQQEIPKDVREFIITLDGSGEGESQ